MTGTKAERRLAAILAMDVVGYSTLVERDDGHAGTAAEPADRSDQATPGRASRPAGQVDGRRSACRVWQRRRRGRLAPWRFRHAAPTALPLRIGVNLGDVVAEGDDLLGRRREHCISAGGLGRSGRSGGFRHGLGPPARPPWPHLRKPRRAEAEKYCAVPCAHTAWSGGPLAPRPPRQRPAGTERPAIAILPFENISGDLEQTYFSDGITEDVITELARFRELLVIARNSSFAFRGKAVTCARSAARLGPATSWRAACAAPGSGSGSPLSSSTPQRRALVGGRTTGRSRTCLQSRTRSRVASSRLSLSG